MNKTLAVDSRINEKSLEKLLHSGYDIIKIPENRHFDAPISAHPDIFMTNICGKWFIDDAVHDMFTIVEDVQTVGRGQATVEKYKYPDDVFLNCVQVGKYIVCNKKHTCVDVLNYAEKNGITIVDVKQGYAKCSICVVCDNAVITEDTGIAKDLTLKTDLDVLLIEKGHVELSGYDYGFFGGCCGLIEKNLIAFNGRVENHPDFCKIKCFCDKYGVGIVSLSDDNLYDIGTVFRII